MTDHMFQEQKCYCLSLVYTSLEGLCFEYLSEDLRVINMLTFQGKVVMDELSTIYHIINIVIYQVANTVHYTTS